MKALFRVDASAAIGSGHLVRCLTLAQELRRRGARCRFVGRELPEHLAASVRSGGHELHSLGPAAGGDSPEAVWPLQAQLDDAAAVGEMRTEGWDWLVVDHYGLGADWERAARPAARRLLAIDDLNRPHDCDGVLDVNEQPDAPQYVDARERGAACLLGPRYALLKPEFLAARTALSPRDGEVRRLLVFMGGMDGVNATERVLEAIAMVDRSLEVDVVIGPSHPARTRIEALAGTWPGLRCHVQTANMAKLAAGADLAIGAGGGASWERCALGLPTLALSLAENQRIVLERAARRGLVVAPAGLAPDPETLAMHLRCLIANPALRHHLSSSAMAAVDGRGAFRVASFMQYAGIQVRPARADDSKALLSWRNQPAIRSASRDTAEIGRADHEQWLAGVLACGKRQLLVGELDGEPIGVVRFDNDIEAGSAEVSIYRIPSPATAGAGASLLRAAEAWLHARHPGIRLLRADVLRDNLPSHQLFLDAGYSRDSTRYLKEL